MVQVINIIYLHPMITKVCLQNDDETPQFKAIRQRCNARFNKMPVVPAFYPGENFVNVLREFDYNRQMKRRAVPRWLLAGTVSTIQIMIRCRCRIEIKKPGYNRFDWSISFLLRLSKCLNGLDFIRHHAFEEILDASFQCDHGRRTTAA